MRGASVLRGKTVTSFDGAKSSNKLSGLSFSMLYVLGIYW